MTNILFICKHNRFRIRVASAYFNKINKNPANHARGAESTSGILAFILRLIPLNRNEINLSREIGLDIKGKPHLLTSRLLKWADVYVIAANNVSPSILRKSKKFWKKVIVWKIPDADWSNKKEIKHSINLIIKHVNKLVRELK